MAKKSMGLGGSMSGTASEQLNKPRRREPNSQPNNEDAKMARIKSGK